MSSEWVCCRDNCCAFLSHFQPQVPFFLLLASVCKSWRNRKRKLNNFLNLLNFLHSKLYPILLKWKYPNYDTIYGKKNQKLLCLLRHNPSTISVSDKDISVIHHHHIQLLNASSKKWVRLVQGICWVDCGGLGWEHFTPFFIMVYSQAQ